MLVSGGKDVLVIGDKRAFRIDGALHVTQLSWPAELILDEIQSAAFADGKLALTGKAHDHDPDKTFPVVLLADEAQLARIYRPGSDVIRAHVSNVLSVEPMNREGEDEPKETLFAVYLQEDNAVYRMPFYNAGRDADDDRHPVEVGLRPSTVEKIVWKYGDGPLFLCATERRHLDEKQAPVMPTIAIDVYGHDHETPEVKPLPPVLVGADDVLALVRTLTPGLMLDPQKLASHAGAMVGVPLGANILWLGDGQAILVDAEGNRVDRVSKAASLRVVTDDASPAWILICALLSLAALSLPVFVWRALRAADVANARALFGTLRIPDGGALSTDKRGHVDISAGTHIRIDGHDVELGPGLRRADGRIDVPLIDGDSVFVLGQVQGDDAGPWRSSGRKRFVAEAGRHHIGRGTASDYAEQMTERANGAILKVAVGVMVIALVVLLRFGGSL
jgi:hypothetical protein